MDNEVWKAYPEFSFVEASNLGRVMTLDRVVTCGNGMRVVKGHVLKQWRNMYGYLYVSFGVDGKLITRKVHRLVAQTFLPNPNNWPEVNHKDCDRTKNNVENLEWCTHGYNMQYREKYGESAGRPMFAINLNTLEVSRFKSQGEAGRELKANQGNINSVLKGRCKTAGGYWFTYDNGDAVETTRNKFGDIVADQVEELMNELQPA